VGAASTSSSVEVREGASLTSSAPSGAAGAASGRRPNISTRKMTIETTPKAIPRTARPPATVPRPRRKNARKRTRSMRPCSRSLNLEYKRTGTSRMSGTLHHPLGLAASSEGYSSLLTTSPATSRVVFEPPRS
jgi:hypothetical protein